MKILLDTCAILWAVSSPEKLTNDARESLLSSNSRVYVSPISAAEIACAVERERIKLDCHWKQWFRKYIKTNDWELVPIDLAIVEEAYSLPSDFHKDPVDRLLVATCRINDMNLLTADELILSYPHVNCIW